ncbi:MAG: damage-inducible mutagenesis protein [Acetobacteraceae bacterium]|nr:damage-inducible mutagenesis protein [Acetobacteraceae bacterium]
MFSSAASSALLHDLRAKIARIEHGAQAGPGHVLPFGLAPLDAALPGGGLALGALHEAAGAGPDVEQGAAAALLIGGILARLQGPVLWVVQRPDLFAPGLAGVGLHPDRVVFAEAGKAVLAVMEEGLRQPGLTAVVGEVDGRLSLVASRRLQLAAEQGGRLAFALRRSRSFDDPALNEPTAAVTRWRITALPSPPPLPEAPDTPGLGRARWQLALRRCRGGEPGSWIVEACDAQGRLGLPAEFRDGSAAETWHGASQGSAPGGSPLGHRAA